MKEEQQPQKDSGESGAAGIGHNCAAVEARLVDYRYGELSAQLLRETAAHLSQCGACAIAYCRLDADLRSVSQEQEEVEEKSEPSKASFEALRREVAKRYPPREDERRSKLEGRRSIRRWLKLSIPAYQVALGSAAALLLVLGGDILHSGEGRNIAENVTTAHGAEGRPVLAPSSVDERTSRATRSTEARTRSAGAHRASDVAMLSDFDSSAIITIAPNTF